MRFGVGLEKIVARLLRQILGLLQNTLPGLKSSRGEPNYSIKLEVCSSDVTDPLAINDVRCGCL